MNETRSGQSTRASSNRREAAYLSRVSVLERQGMLEEAVAALHKAMAVSPNKASHCMRLAELYRSLRKMDEAIEAIKRAIELDPKDMSNHEWLLQMYMEVGMLDEAVGECKSVIRQFPRNILAYDILAAAYLQQGQLDAALKVTSDLVRLNPTDASNHFKRAVLYQQKGDIIRSIEEFTRVLEMQPDVELAEAAVDAVATLDGYQIRQILALAEQDMVFRAKLMRDPVDAISSRGFLLSVMGLMALKQMDFSAESFQSYDGPGMYN